MGYYLPLLPRIDDIRKNKLRLGSYFVEVNLAVDYLNLTLLVIHLVGCYARCYSEKTALEAERNASLCSFGCDTGGTVSSLCQPYENLLLLGFVPWFARA